MSPAADEMSDQAADPDAFTHMLMAVVRDVVVTMHDCGTTQSVAKQGIYMRLSNDLGRPRSDEIVGRVICHSITDPCTGEEILRAGEPIPSGQARQLDALGIAKIIVRSPMTCEAPSGVCRLCYGIDLSRNSLVAEGAAVGALAARALGDLAKRLDISRVVMISAMKPECLDRRENLLGNTQRLTEIFQARRPPAPAVLAEIDGQVVRISQGLQPDTCAVHVQETDHDCNPVGKVHEYPVPAGSQLRVGNTYYVRKGEPLIDGPIDPNELRRILGRHAARDYLLREFQDCYVAQPKFRVDDRHAELVLAQLFRAPPGE
jgi:DNA-directed RNA polymerase subunit beta'